MKRALLAVVGTVAGLISLLGYKSSSTKLHLATGPLSSGTTGSSGAPETSGAPDTSAPDAPTTASPPVTPGATAAPPRTTHAPTTKAPSSTTPAVQTITGPVEPNQYGDVQVQVTIDHGQITSVTAPQLPHDRRRSQEISNYAAPILSQEALQAQSANIDSVSGATYTSEGYAQSLQAALDQVRK